MSDAPQPSAAADPDHPLVGQVVSERYRIEALLGEGGMGAVYRARHLSLDRPVAIKVLHARLVEDEQVQQRFEREALAISKLDHPNCVRVMDFGTTPEGMKYLVMPFLEGQELRDVTGVGLPSAEVVDLGVQILQALDHAHRRGLVHRDLKPENVFLVRGDDDDRVVKLVDFGIVKLLESEGLAQLTRAGMAFGTPTYMSPEQAAGGKIDERTDLYSLGVVLYELLTGVPPFTADEPAMLMRMHILTDPPPLPDTVPGPLAEVVSRLLAKEPHERYATAREARRALVAAVAGEGASMTPSSGAAVLLPLGGPAAVDPATLLDAPAEPAPDVVAAAVPPPSASGSAPVVPVRSGGTVMASSSMSHGAAPVAAGFASVVPPVPPVPHASPHGPGPGAAASFGALPIPMSVPSYSGRHPIAPLPRRDTGRRGGLVLLFVALSLPAWALLAWMLTRDEPTDAASSRPATPAPAVTPARPAAETPAVVARPADAGAEPGEPKARPSRAEREKREREVAKRRAEQERLAEKWRAEQAKRR